jgi:hypothetical protein
MKGNDPLLAAGRRVRNAAVAVTAIKKCSALERELIRVATGMTSDPVTMLLNLTPEQLVTAARELGSGWLWEMMVVPAMTNEPATEPVRVGPRSPRRAGRANAACRATTLNSAKAKKTKLRKSQRRRPRECGRRRFYSAGPAGPAQ